MNTADLPDDSDSSDEDYVPEGITAELPSEEESDGDPEDLLPNEHNTKRGAKRQKKRAKKKRKSNPPEIEETPPKETKVNKQQTDDLWADFKKDTGFKTRAERLVPENDPSSKETNHVKPKETEMTKAQVPKTVKVTQVFKFAGEEVKVEKEVSANIMHQASGSESSSKRPNGGGLGSVLNQLGKKPKINTLEKSKLDWEQFKKDEKIEDELSAYGKSKDGYLERQDFLERADLRRFEIEKQIRSTLRSNRLNN